MGGDACAGGESESVRGFGRCRIFAMYKGPISHYLYTCPSVKKNCPDPAMESASSVNTSIEAEARNWTHRMPFARCVNRVDVVSALL